MARLFFHYGEMGSGKTAQLIHDAEILEDSFEDFKAAIVMKPMIDTKNGSKLLSRNGGEREVDYIISNRDNLYKIMLSSFDYAAALFIDEAQFLTKSQAEQLLAIATNLDIEVHAYGLRLNFNLGDENFAGATRLLQIAHELIRIDSQCDLCGKNQAIFSCLFEKEKIVKKAPTILISDGEKEVNAHAICAECYYQFL